MKLMSPAQPLQPDAGAGSGDGPCKSAAGFEQQSTALPR